MNAVIDYRSTPAERQRNMRYYADGAAISFSLYLKKAARPLDDTRQMHTSSFTPPCHADLLSPSCPMLSEERAASGKRPGRFRLYASFAHRHDAHHLTSTLWLQRDTLILMALFTACQYLSGHAISAFRCADEARLMLLADGASIFCSLDS